MQRCFMEEESGKETSLRFWNKGTIIKTPKYKGKNKEKPLIFRSFILTIIRNRNILSVIRFRIIFAGNKVKGHARIGAFDFLRIRRRILEDRNRETISGIYQRL